MNYNFWFICGSQDLYGDECLRIVAEHAAKMVDTLNSSNTLPCPVVLQPTLITNETIRNTLTAANNDPACAGIIVWMHTFSPAKMWIHGLQAMKKPILHLHTQFNREIPWDTIDMDFMNQNQSAHGDREFGHMMTRMGIRRKVLSGHLSNPALLSDIASWMQTAVGVAESAKLRILRVGDNMRDVAVTEGDKVEAELKFGWEIDAYNITDVAEYVRAVSDSDTNALTDEYYASYDLVSDGLDPAAFRHHVAEQAKIEIGFRRFLEEHNYHAVVTSFQMLSGLNQLPGLAMQRLMADGYGFGAEGDWKTAGMVRIMKQMAALGKQQRGTSFMEDYTYHLTPGEEAILQAHMLEVCPSIAAQKPAIRVCPLSMGNREDPARLIFTAKPGRGVAASLVDLGNRFRLIVNEVDVVETPHKMPNLPVATALWKPLPDFRTGTEGWIYAGGAHHTSFSYDLSAEQLSDWAEIMGIECVRIGEGTTISSLKQALMLGEVYYSVMK